MSPLTITAYSTAETDDPSFVEYLPYLACVSDTVLLRDSHGRLPTVGRIWELTPVCLEGASEERWEVVSTALNGLLLRLPEESACQFMLMGDTHTDQALATFLQHTRMHGLSQLACEDRVRLYQAGGTLPLFTHKGVPFHCRLIRAYCTVRLWPPGPRRHETVTQWWETAIGGLATVEETLQEGLRLAGIGLRRLSADDSKALLWRLLNPDGGQAPAPYRDDCLLREQVLAHRVDVDGQGITVGTQKIIALSALEPPFETRAGMLIREMEFGGTYAALLDLFPDLCLVWNLHILNQQLAYQRIKRHRWFAWTNRFDPFRGEAIETQIVGEDLNNTLAEIFGRGNRVIATGIHALVARPPADIAGYIDRVIAAVGHVGMRMMAEESIGASLVRHCLPLGFDPQAEQSLRRAYRFVSTNIADMLPVYGHFRGVGQPKFLYLSRRGEPVAFDPFAAAPAPHMLVVGATGAGKSMLVNDLLLQALRLPARIFVLDKGDSYGRLCRVLGGEHLVVEPEHPRVINPFLGSLTQEKLGILWQLVVEMMQGREHHDILSKEEEGIVERAIIDTYRRMGTEEVTLSDVAATLHGMGTYPARLAFRLQPFLREGRYGRYFDGCNELALQAPLTVFELGNLSRDPELQKIMNLMLINLITQIVTTDRGRYALKIVVKEEGWADFESENAARFYAEATRTYRKYGTAMISVTQQPRDFLSSRGGQAIRDNSPIRVLLQQTPEVAAAVADELQLSPERKRLFLSLESIPGKFSEALLDTPTQSGVMRVVLPPSVYWMATTHDQERFYLEQLTQQRGSVEAAILEAAATHPHGLVGDDVL